MLRAPSCKPYFNNHKVNVHERTEALGAVHKGYPTFQLVSRFAKMGYEAGPPEGFNCWGAKIFSQ